MKNKNIFLSKINEIRKALDLGLYNCALTMALTLPDICGKVEYPSKSTSYRYTEWFDNYAAPYFTVDAKKLPVESIVKYTWLNKDECYALRNAVLHAGNYDVKEKRKKKKKKKKLNNSNKLQKFIAHAHKINDDNYSHICRDEVFADMDVILLCENLCTAAEDYYNNNKHKELFVIDEVEIIEE